MTRDEIAEVKSGLETELRGTMAKAKALADEMEKTKARVSELRGGITTLDTILKADESPPAEKPKE